MEGSGFTPHASDGVFKIPVSTQAGFENTLGELLECSKWSPERIAVEFYLFFVLMENIFFGYVVISLFKKVGNCFFSSCLLIVSSCGATLAVLLLIFPFAFTWRTEESIPYDILSVDSNLSFKRNLSMAYQIPKTLHGCQQAVNTLCKVTGFLFGFLLFTPLVSQTMICFDAVMAGFCWKRYRLRPHHISTMRLTMLLCLLLTVGISFALPVVEAGAHYHYNSFYRICWLPTTTEQNMELRFVLFAFGFVSIVLLIHLASSCVLVKAVSSKPSASLRANPGNECWSLFAHVAFTKSEFWASHRQSTLGIVLATPTIYFPITIGFILKCTLFSPQRTLVWYNVLARTSILLTLMVPQTLYLSLVGPYRRRAADIFKNFFHTRERQRRVSSPVTSETSSCEQHRPASEHHNRKMWVNADDNFVVEKYDRIRENHAKQPTLYDSQFTCASTRGPVLQAVNYDLHGQRAEESSSRFAQRTPNVYFNRQRLRRVEPIFGATASQIPTWDVSHAYLDEGNRISNAVKVHQQRRQRIERQQVESPRLFREASLPRVLQQYWRNMPSLPIDQRRFRRPRIRARNSGPHPTPWYGNEPPSFSQQRSAIFSPDRGRRAFGENTFSNRSHSHSGNSRFGAGGHVSREMMRSLQQDSPYFPSAVAQQIGKQFSAKRSQERRQRTTPGEDYSDYSLFSHAPTRPTGDKASSENSTPARRSHNVYEQTKYSDF